MRGMTTALACASVAAALATPARAFASPGPTVGQEAPEIAAREWINSDPVTLAQLRGEHVVLIEFWSTT